MKKISRKWTALLLYALALPVILSFMAIGPVKPAIDKPITKLTESKFSTDSSASIAQIENQAFDLVNKHRESIGLPALINKDYITEQSRRHSRDMALGKVDFGHEGAANRLNIISKSLKTMNAGGENVFYCTGNYANLAQTALEGWLKSPEHRANIEGDYNLSGMGVARAANGDYYFTQIFVKGAE